MGHTYFDINQTHMPEIQNLLRVPRYIATVFITIFIIMYLHDTLLHLWHRFYYEWCRLPDMSTRHTATSATQPSLPSNMSHEICTLFYCGSCRIISFVNKYSSGRDPLPYRCVNVNVLYYHVYTFLCLLAGVHFINRYYLQSNVCNCWSLGVD